MGIIPFLGILSRIFHGKTGLPCQSGSEAITITTDGKILACPIAPEFKWNNLGNFHNYKKIEIGGKCKTCDVFKICGGRCLLAHKEKFWGIKGFKTVCTITKFLIYELKKYENRLAHISNKINYPPYNNTTEIIP